MSALNKKRGNKKNALSSSINSSTSEKEVKSSTTQSRKQHVVDVETVEKAQSFPVVSKIKLGATTPSPSKYENDDPTIIGYVHCLSPVKRNKKNTMDYSTLLLQTSDSPPQETLLYSRHKRQLLKDSEDSHTPVKIQRYTYTHDQSKIIINDKTHISIPNQSEYSFQYEGIGAQSAKALSVEEILRSSNEWDSVTFCGKAVHIGETSVIAKKQLKLAEATFADTTGVIAVDLWEQHIDMIESDNVYRFSPVQVRVWNGVKKLSTTTSSVITKMVDDTSSDTVKLKEVSVSDEDIKSQSHMATVKVENIHSVQAIESFIACINCSRKLLQSSSNNIAHCDRCGYTMRDSSCTKQLCAKFVVLCPENKPIHLTAFQNVLETVIDDVANLSEKDVAEKLLFLVDLTITYNSQSLVATQMQQL